MTPEQRIQRSAFDAVRSDEDLNKVWDGYEGAWRLSVCHTALEAALGAAHHEDLLGDEDEETLRNMSQDEIDRFEDSVAFEMAHAATVYVATRIYERHGMSEDKARAAALEAAAIEPSCSRAEP